MAPALVLSSPVGLPLALGLNLGILHLKRLDYFRLAGLQSLVRLRGQLEHFLTAHLILTQISC